MNSCVPPMVDRRKVLGAFLLIPSLTASGIASARDVRGSDRHPSFPDDRRRMRQLINVTTRGGRGDNHTDNTACILKCLEELKAAGGGTLFFPPGNYRFSSIDFEIQSLEMFGKDATLISTLPKVTKLPALWLRAANLHVHDLTIDYADPIDVRIATEVEARGADAYGLRLGGRRKPTALFASQVRIERVNVRYARGGGIQVSYASNVVVQDCSVHQALGNGIGFDGCLRNVKAIRNIVDSTGDDLLVVVTDNSVPSGTKDVLFAYNKVSNGFAKGIASSGVDGMLIEHNEVVNTFAGGIVVMSDTFYNLGRSVNVIVRENTVREAGKNFGAKLFRIAASNVGDSIYISSGTRNVSIIGNDLADGVRDGIVVTNSSGIRVEQNRVKHHPYVGIHVGNSDRPGPPLIDKVTVIGNTVATCSTGVLIGRTSDGIVRGNVVTDINSPQRKLMLVNNVRLTQQD